MWIIASLPFWVCGFMLFIVGAVALIALASGCKGTHSVSEVLGGAFMFILAGGVLLCIAAKVAS